MHKISGVDAIDGIGRYELLWGYVFLCYLLLALSNEKWNKGKDSSRLTRIALSSLTLCVLWLSLFVIHWTSLQQQSALMHQDRKKYDSFAVSACENHFITDVFSIIFVITIKLIKRYESDSVTKRPLSFLTAIDFMTNMNKSLKNRDVNFTSLNHVIDSNVVFLFVWEWDEMIANNWQISSLHTLSLSWQLYLSGLTKCVTDFYLLIMVKLSKPLRWSLTVTMANGVSLSSPIQASISPSY